MGVLLSDINTTNVHGIGNYALNLRTHLVETYTVKIVIENKPGINDPEGETILHDYDSIKGVSFYHNNIEQKEVSEVTKFLKDKFGGNPLEKSQRIILTESKVIYSPKDISQLALDLESKFDVKGTITLEFANMSEEDAKSYGLPEAKLLPIPGK